MFVIALLIFVSLSLALVFLVSFIWAVRTGQFEDTCTPSMRVLADETTAELNPSIKDKNQPP